MAAFAAAWPAASVGQRIVAQLPWGHNVDLLDRLGTEDERLWYAQRAIASGWSRATLASQIKSRLHLRAGSATTSFETALPAGQSELMQELTKDPYSFEFLGLTDRAAERRFAANSEGL